MKARLKVDSQWLELEKKSMAKMRQAYERWQSETLQRAKDAKDLRSLRELFYEMGDRWEWDQATGSWLSKTSEIEMVGLVLRMPGLDENKERFVIYLVMAYSKGVTSAFDHLGDKERIIIEQDLRQGSLRVWSTTGHGAMDLFPTELRGFESVNNSLQSCILVAQPGDHALRLELPKSSDEYWTLGQRLWSIVTGETSFSTRRFNLLDAEGIEEKLEFRFYRYAKAVIDLEHLWKRLQGTILGAAREAVLDRVPDHIETYNRHVLRRIEGLLHVLWFRPPYRQIDVAKRLYSQLSSESVATEMKHEVLAALDQLVRSLTDVIEKAKYIKWKSVIDRKSFGNSEAFRGLEISDMAKEAFAAALDDILKEHTLAYIGYPERATMKGKVTRVVFGLLVLPTRLMVTGIKHFRQAAARLRHDISRRLVKTSVTSPQPE
ncbi:MAG: hypothetical protein HXY34_10735 [Candidatus Thorarchaeota archaeon]|nr:hypothetical protein [Candidatus Thorarchaeota archaeon]